MARLSKTVKSGENAIPENYITDLSTCFFCDTKIKKGGCWAGRHHIGVCQSCSFQLADLLIDTLEDSIAFEKLSLDDRKKYIANIFENRLLYKETLKK